jgi:hypothetical protein
MTAREKLHDAHSKSLALWTVDANAVLSANLALVICHVTLPIQMIGSTWLGGFLFCKEATG